MTNSKEKSQSVSKLMHVVVLTKALSTHTHFWEQYILQRFSTVLEIISIHTKHMKMNKYIHYICIHYTHVL